VGFVKHCVLSAHKATEDLAVHAEELELLMVVWAELGKHCVADRDDLVMSEFRFEYVCLGAALAAVGVTCQSFKNGMLW
jgi:hypothetical protein